MEFSRNTSTGKSKTSLVFLIKITLIFILIFVAVMFLSKIDYPSPNKEIEKIIPNENLKIVK